MQSTIEWRKRNRDGFLENSPFFKDVFVVFKIAIPAGHSKFEVPIPKNYRDREFSFDDLFLIPVLYSDQAQEYDMETEEERNEVLLMGMSLRINFDDRNDFYPDVYIGKRGMTTTVELAKEVNNFFEIKKPAAILHLGAFFDWYDLRFDPEGDETFDQFIQKMALVYYGEPYDSSKHYNALPPSARSIYDVNNYLFPTVITRQMLENVRYRINIAPNTNMIFSTDGHLLDMGFSAAQIGKRIGRNQFYFFNSHKTAYLVIPAQDEMSIDLNTDPVTFKVRLGINNSIFISEPNYVSISRKDAEKNPNYEKSIKKTMEEFAMECNLKFGISYDDRSKKFTFVFPNNSQNSMRDATVILSTELSERLGFEQVTEITELNKTGNRVEDAPDPKDTEDKARALGYDTSVVIVSDANESFTTASSGVAETYMASLYPTKTGTMQMKINPFCKEQPSMMVDGMFADAPATIPAVFSLSTFLDHNRMIKFNWKVGAFVNGTLRGIHPSKKFDKPQLSFL